MTLFKTITLNKKGLNLFYFKLPIHLINKNHLKKIHRYNFYIFIFIIFPMEQCLQGCNKVISSGLQQSPIHNQDPRNIIFIIYIFYSYVQPYYCRSFHNLSISFKMFKNYGTTDTDTKLGVKK